MGVGAEAPSLGATLEAKLAPGSQGAKWEPGSQGVAVGVAVRVVVPAKAAVRLVVGWVVAHPVVVATVA